MNILTAIILGIVEGVTEFLPISSTFHLIWSSRLLGLPQTQFHTLFEVVIQSGAVVAVLFLYRRTLVDKKILHLILWSFLPTALIGFLFYSMIKNLFANYLLQIVVFIIFGILFIAFEHIAKKFTLQKDASNLTKSAAVLVGVAQAIAVVPGVSRAGIVLIALMLLGVKRTEAAKYSFLLAVPTILMASAYDLYKMHDTILNYQSSYFYLAIGFIVSFLSALVVIKWFIRFLTSHTLVIFGWYRVLAGLLLFTFLR